MTSIYQKTFMSKTLKSIVVLSATTIAFMFVSGNAIAMPQYQQVQLSSTNPQIDYDGFVDATTELRDYRASRLVSIDEFMEMSKKPKTIILDTRSKAAFDQGHIDGAVHLNFSDFTSRKLRKVIPNKKTRILIYCNNNFSDDRAPVAVKSASLALNIPTFINLHGYGYENIYEMRGVTRLNDPRIKWVSSR